MIFYAITVVTLLHSTTSVLQLEQAGGFVFEPAALVLAVAALLFYGPFGPLLVLGLTTALAQTSASPFDRYVPGEVSRSISGLGRGDEETAEKKKNAAANNFVKRVISHPNFHNVTYKDAERMLAKLEQGDAIIRPSSKLLRASTVTWTWPSTKNNQFTLGKKLVIGNGDEFEDLEEIISRYIQPMASYCREALNHRYALEHSQSEKKEEIDAHLHTMKRENPNKIPYCFTPSAAYPGKLTINYLVGKLRQEYFTPQPDGLRFRKQVFNSLEQMLGWFKLHYREAPAPMFGGNRSSYR